ncbi:FAD/NAD-P-binding domain-containing protein [Ganoderma leucocontextum]|nr:FAD/NAD-P-binding domain-containing protein [Ganoderma leucocontextum]
MQSPDFLPIDFLIVGGSICGLSSAISLRRAGHNVTVFDFDDPFVQNPFQAGCRLPPNSTKIYYRWGLEQRLRDASITATGNLFAAYDTGRVYGGHDWEDDVISETGGDFLCMHFFELRRILAEAAVEHGAKVHPPMKVESVHPHPDRPWITLENGEVVYGDVIVGCDGSSWKDWVTRTAVLKAFGQGEVAEPTGMQFFNVMIPDAGLDDIRDEGLRTQLRKTGKVFTWLGAEYSAIGYPIKAPGTWDPKFVLFVYGPRYEEVGTKMVWKAHKEELLAVVNNADPRLAELAAGASSISCVQMPRRNPCPEWVHPDGRLLVIGEGAHPLVIGTIYAPGMATGDAAALGRVFSHLTRRDQIDSFLSAVQEVRKERVEDVMRRASGNIFAVSIPPAVAAAHDREMDRQVEKGLKSLEGKRRIQPQSSEQLMAAVENIFAIDPEDEADNWWVQWGSLESRAARWNLADGEVKAESKDEEEELEEEKKKQGKGWEAAFTVAEQVTVVTTEPASEVLPL